MKINCYFCDKPLDGHKLSPTMVQCVCDECPEICATTYSFSSVSDELKRWSATITFEDKGIDYQAVYFPPNVFYIIELTLDINGLPQPHRRVMQLSFCPTQITPHNIKRKFPTLKVWS